MKKNVLLQTNIFICTVIIMGFLLTSFISYRSNTGIFKQDTEHISELTLDGIYHQIDSIFAKPINISLTMANDSLLKTFLTEEGARGDEEAFIQTMRSYLLTYKEKYLYDSVFLVSANSNRYYHFDTGIDRVLTADNPENQWYYSFLESPDEYALNIDNDEVQAANNEINIFINCKIYSPDGTTLGVVGVGFSVTTMQAMLQDYENNFQLRAYLIDSLGNIEISTANTGYEKIDLFETGRYRQYRNAILSGSDNIQSFWYSSDEGAGFLMSRYIPNLSWYLVIDNDTSAIEADLNRQLFLGMTIIIIVIGVVLLIITNIIRKYNTRIVSLTVEKEKIHRTVLQTETAKMYENIYEFDITHDRAANEGTEHYFESLGISKRLSYDKALRVIAEKQIHEDFREGYLQTFSRDHVLNSYEEGLDSLKYDFMTTNDDGATYYWMRITARIFFWEDDQSVRILVYRQNIDSEKRLELSMTEQMQLDSLSGLYNKAATQELARKMMSENPDRVYAFFILDIDNFKTVNDTLGHATGDMVIADFAQKLKQQFRKDDIVGRIGGDEFVALLPISSKEVVEKKARALAQALHYDYSSDSKHCSVSASIGVAVSPEAGKNFETLYQNADSALYQTKRKGKQGFTLYQTPPQ